MKTNPNDYVYPITDSAELTVIDPGLTKLEYFAALAMQGLCAAQDVRMGMGMPLDQISANQHAKDAVMSAKALITELNKEQ